jgi:hypothetical protein
LGYILGDFFSSSFGHPGGATTVSRIPESHFIKLPKNDANPFISTFTNKEKWFVA